MINRLGLYIFLTSALFLSACSSLSKSECVKGDWASIGAKDALKGLRAKTRLSQHNSACAKHKISPNNKLYYSGYATGLRQFCTRRNGFKYGANANEYYDICPASLKRNFLVGYLPGLGLAINELHGDINNLRYERRKKKRRLRSLERKKKNNKKELDRIEKLKGSLANLRSSISSKHSKIDKLEAWQRVWSYR